jgi:hypothetical protein
VASEPPSSRLPSSRAKRLAPLAAGVGVSARVWHGAAGGARASGTAGGERGAGGTSGTAGGGRGGGAGAERTSDTVRCCRRCFDSVVVEWARQN